MATVPFLFFFEGEGDFFGIMIIVHLPVAKFWAALIIGVHWLSGQVWSFTPTSSKRCGCIQSLDTGWISPMLAKCCQQAPDRHFWQTGKQHSAESGSDPHSHFVSSAWKRLNPSKCFPGLLSLCSAWRPRGGSSRRHFRITKSKILFGCT